MLPHELAILDISQPCLTATKKHNARSAQDHQTGKQGQHAKADKLTMGDEDAPGMDCLLQGDLKKVSLRWSDKLVEGVSRKGIVLRSQRKHSVIHRLGTDWRGPGLWPVLQGTCRPRKPFLANALEGSIRLTDTCAPAATWFSGAGGEAAGVIASETSEALRTDAREGQAVARTVATVEAGVGLTAVNADFTKVSIKPRGA